MADSYRLVVLKRLTSLLETITIANGYQHDLAGKVFRGRAVYGANEPLPMLSILEAPRPDGFTRAGDGEARNESWLLLLQGWANDDKENPLDPVYALIDDVEKCLSRIVLVDDFGNPRFPEHYMLGGDIGAINLNPPTARPATTELSSKAFFYMPLQVSLARVAHWA